MASWVPIPKPGVRLIYSKITQMPHLLTIAANFGSYNILIRFDEKINN